MKTKIIFWLIIFFAYFGSVWANDLLYLYSGNIYKKNADDVSNWSAITTIGSIQGTTSFSPDNLYIYYLYSGNIYKKNANDVSNWSEITTIGGILDFKPSPDNLYIYYLYSGNIYKKNANDVSNWSAITTIGGITSLDITQNNLYIYYSISSPTYTIYKKNANDVSNWSEITGAFYPSKIRISPNNLYITYWSNVSYWLRQLTIGWTDRLITSTYSPTTNYDHAYSLDWNFIFYINPWGQDIYKKNANDVSNWSEITSHNWVSGVWIAYTSILFNPTVNWSCWTNATAYAYTETAYTGAFCASWTPSPTTPAFPTTGSVITWNCEGSNWGTTASCEAIRQATPPINWVCWENAKIFACADTSYWTGAFCASWTPSPTTPAFPTAGSVITWNCEGSNWGTTQFCNSWKYYCSTINWSCWSNSRQYKTTETAYIWSFCSAGTSLPTTPAFPTAGSGAIQWMCVGDDWGNTAQCEAYIDEGGIFSFFDFTPIVNSINELYAVIQNLSDFDFQYLWFNLDLDNLYKIFSFNLTTTGITPTSTGCENITINTKIYSTSSCQSIYGCGISYWSYPTGLLIYLPQKNVNAEWIWDNYIDNNSYTLYQYNKLYFWIPEYWGGEIIQKKSFAYINNVADSNIINMNTAIFTGVNWFPFVVVVAGIDLAWYINDFINWSINFVLEIIKIPVDMLNILFNLINVVNINYSNWWEYCFAGTKLIINNSTLWGTRLDSVTTAINNNIKVIWANTSNVGAIIYLIFLIIISTKTFKKFYKLI